MNEITAGLDWARIRHLYRLGLFAAVLVCISDLLLGWGVADESLSGLERYLSAYVGLSDARLFWSALLGLIGIPVEALCYFSVYRLMQKRAARHAHIYRAGILGYLAFGACGFHVPCLAVCYVYNRLYETDPALALDVGIKYGLYFMLPALALFFVAFFVLVITQLSAFARGLTPYPRWCWVFSLLFYLVVGAVMLPLGNTAFANGISAAWISIANLWMFGGLLAMSKRAEAREKA